MKGNRGWIYLGSLILVVCGGLMILLDEPVVGLSFISLGLVFLVLPSGSGKNTAANTPRWLRWTIAVVGIGIAMLFVFAAVFHRPF
jgi:hypothetical protein